MIKKATALTLAALIGASPGSAWAVMARRAPVRFSIPGLAVPSLPHAAVTPGVEALRAVPASPGRAKEIKAAIGQLHEAVRLDERARHAASGDETLNLKASGERTFDLRPARQDSAVGGFLGTAKPPELSKPIQARTQKDRKDPVHPPESARGPPRSWIAVAISNGALGAARASLLTLFLGLPALSQQQAPAPSDSKPAAEKKIVNDRIFFVVPNFRTEEGTGPFQPLSRMDKLDLWRHDSFDPFAFPLAGFYAGVAHVENSYPDWGRGPAGFGKRYGAAFVDQTVGNFMTEFAVPSMLHQDPRYFRLGKGGFWRRTGYAVSRVFITRSDRGGNEFNYSEFVGNSAMAAISDTYIPRGDRTLEKNASRVGFQVGMDMFSNIMKEFWPDIKHGLFRK